MTSSLTYIAQSVLSASAMASEGLASIIIVSPARFFMTIIAKKVLSRNSVTTMRSTLAPISVMTLRRRSCVIGLWGVIFSISKAIALASYAPTQIGSIVSLFTSFRMIMGVALVGSIIRPRILTSI